MHCCQCQGIEDAFDKTRAGRELRKYRKKGPKRTTRLLLDALRGEGIHEKTLLDIGGGVGAIQHVFLRSGGRSVTSVDASPAYLDAAREEAERQGYADRVHYHHGDFVEMAESIAPADVATLDRVICCYHDMPALVGHSAERARHVYGVVYPRDTWWVKVGFVLINLTLRIRRDPFRVFLHPTEAVEALVRSSGFQRRFYQQTLLWQVAVYAR